MSEIGDLKKHWTLNRVILPRSGIFRGEAVTITLTGAPAFSKAVLCLESQRGGCKYVQRLICEMLRYPRNNIFLKVEGFCLSKAMQHFFCCCGSNFVRTFSDVLMMPVCEAIFIPVKDECKDAVPRVSLDLKSRGLFTVNSAELGASI